MANAVRADSVQIAQLAQVTLDAAVETADGFRAEADAVRVPAEAFGGVEADDLRAAYQEVTELMGHTWDVMVTLYEYDADGLYQTAAAYQDADLAAQHGFTTVTGTVPPRR